jgi:dihydroorotate dehydrogenase electron transfer subunit
MTAYPRSTVARTISVTEPAADYVELLLEAPEVARRARPGQFLMIRAWSGADPYLPRPFDIMQADPRSGRVRVFVKVEGRGTKLLSMLPPGAPVFCVGPLGQPVEAQEEGGVALLVRGAGAAAVVMLAGAAWQAGLSVFSFLSASTAARVVCREYLEPVSTELAVSTDDGTAGYHGNATDLLDRLLERQRVERVYTCGAKRFARHVKALDRAGVTRGFVFLEGLMACGLGDCHGCAVRRDGEPGYYLVCRDGPHFPLDRVLIE